MKRSIHTLPIAERWDCHSCGYCCRGSTILLDETDLKKLADQKWEDHPDFQGVRTVVRESLLGGRHVLAKQADGSCVFLKGDLRCRIHEMHGIEAKPAICQMFPFQVVPLERTANLTLRRSCPSAAADRGRPVDGQMSALKKSDLIQRFSPSKTLPPKIAHGVRRSWPEFMVTAEALQHLMTDERFPLVRRLVHGLRFCELLSQCKLKQVGEDSWRELIQVLEESATDNAGDFFRDRQAPSRSTSVLFRQLAVHYLRSHPQFKTNGGWRERWRLFKTWSSFARGKGPVPQLCEAWPASDFETLDRELGPLGVEVMQPLNRYFETHAVSKQYAIIVPRQTLVTNFRSLAFTCPMAMWLLRLICGDRTPVAEDMIEIVVALERGQGLSGLPRAANAMAETQQLERLIAWYAR